MEMHTITDKTETQLHTYIHSHKYTPIHRPTHSYTQWDAQLPHYGWGFIFKVKISLHLGNSKLTSYTQNDAILSPGQDSTQSLWLLIWLFISSLQHISQKTYWHYNSSHLSTQHTKTPLGTKVTMGKQHITTSCFVNKDRGPEDLTSNNQLYAMSGNNFREEMLRMF